MKRIIIDRGIFYTKIAAADEKRLLDFRVYENLNKSLVGNVYRGRVCRILPGLKAAFVDIGEGKNGYLPIDKNESIKQGRDVVVQVEKDGMGEKGPKLSLETSLAGRHVILIPEKDVIKVSNKIKDDCERQRLAGMVSEICGSGFGAIVRTNAFGIEKSELEIEMKKLQLQWDFVKKENILGMGPKLLHRAMDPVLEYIRDNYDESFFEIVVNEQSEYEHIKSALKIGVDDLERLKLFEQTSDVFDYYGIKGKIKNLTKKKVWLESGAHIIIEQTEALTVVDVNTGKNVKGFDVEDTILGTNIEAADEIASQIKLRDIGGIVVVDFIDMKSADNRQKLIRRLESLFSDEPGGTFIHGMTKLGLVEITRRNRKKGLDLIFSKECPFCHGAGKVSSDYLVLDSIEKESSRIKKHTNAQAAIIQVPADFYEAMKSDNFRHVHEICEKYSIEIIMLKDYAQSSGKASVRGVGNKKQLIENVPKGCEFKGIYPLTKDS